jgi:hypothetical protein
MTDGTIDVPPRRYPPEVHRCKFDPTIVGRVTTPQEAR